MRAAILVLVAAVAPARADISDSIGPIVGVTFDGRPSVGGTGRLAFGPRLAIDAQARARGGTLAADLELAWTLTHGDLETTYGSGRYPISFTVLGGGGLVDDAPALTFGVALRVRTARWLSVDLIVREAIVRAMDRPHDLTHVPEIQLAISLTAAPR